MKNWKIILTSFLAIITLMMIGMNTSSYAANYYSYHQCSKTGKNERVKIVYRDIQSHGAYCSKCKKWFDIENHNSNKNGKVIEVADCKNRGQVQKNCSKCTATNTGISYTPIDSNNHATPKTSYSYVYYYDTDSKTCYKKYKSTYCPRCYKTLSTSTLDSIVNHKFETTASPTYISTGKKRCTECLANFDIPKLVCLHPVAKWDYRTIDDIKHQIHCLQCTTDTTQANHQFTYTPTNNGEKHIIGCKLDCGYKKEVEHNFVNGKCICGAKQQIPTLKASKLTVYVLPGKSETITINYSDGIGNISAKSNNEAIATASFGLFGKSSLKITGKKYGTTDIIVSASENARYKAASITITVVVPSVKINSVPSLVAGGKSQKASATCTANGDSVKEWKIISNSEVVSVDKNGNLVPNKSGSATLAVYTVLGATASTTVNVFQRSTVISGKNSVQKGAVIILNSVAGTNSTEYVKGNWSVMSETGKAVFVGTNKGVSSVTLKGTEEGSVSVSFTPSESSIFASASPRNITVVACPHSDQSQWEYTCPDYYGSNLNHRIKCLVCEEIFVKSEGHQYNNEGKCVCGAIKENVDGTGNTLAATSITANDMTIGVGYYKQLEYTVKPAGSKVTFSSNKPNVVTVGTNNGILNGKTEGEAQIIVKSENGAVQATATIKVVKREAITLVVGNYLIEEGGKTTIKTGDVSGTWSIFGGNGQARLSTTTGSSVEVTGIKAGRVSILFTPSDSNKYYQAGTSITIVAAAVNNSTTTDKTIVPITVTNGSTMLHVGESVQLSSGGIYGEWKASSGSQYVDLRPGGLGNTSLSVIGLMPGNVKIQFIPSDTDKYIANAIDITVISDSSDNNTPQTPTIPSSSTYHVYLDYVSKGIKVGGSYQFKARCSSSSDVVAGWSSNNTAVVTIDNNGNAKGITPGSAVIKVVTQKGATATCNVIVPKQTIVITGDSKVEEDKSISLKSIIATTGEAVSGKWSIPNGIVTPIEMENYAPTSITVQNKSIGVGQKALLSYTTVPGNAKVTFESSNTNVVTVTAGGILEGKSRGTAEITIKGGNVSAKAKIAVNSAGKITVSPLSSTNTITAQAVTAGTVTLKFTPDESSKYTEAEKTVFVMSKPKVIINYAVKGIKAGENYTLIARCTDATDKVVK